MDAIAWITIPITVSGTILTIFFKINSSNVKKVCKETHDKLQADIKGVSNKTGEFDLIKFKLTTAEEKIDELGKMLKSMSDQLNEIKLSIAARQKKWK